MTMNHSVYMVFNYCHLLTLMWDNTPASDVQCDCAMIVKNEER